MKPSDQCLRDLKAQSGGVVAFSGGELKWEKYYQCDYHKQAIFKTAAADAHTLANFAHALPKYHDAKDIVCGERGRALTIANIKNVSIVSKIFYTTLHYLLTKSVENLGRASDFKGKKAFDIIVSCKDVKNWCRIQKDGKVIGGYAWTYSGYFSYYHYIVMCDPFFLTGSLQDKINQIEYDFSKGETKTAKQVEWQKNTGQGFLHEMMHLDAVGKPHSKFSLYALDSYNTPSFPRYDWLKNSSIPFRSTIIKLFSIRVIANI
jgi:hypothetical protein